MTDEARATLETLLHSLEEEQERDETAITRAAVTLDYHKGHAAAMSDTTAAIQSVLQQFA